MLRFNDCEYGKSVFFDEWRGQPFYMTLHNVKRLLNREGAPRNYATRAGYLTMPYEDIVKEYPCYRCPIYDGSFNAYINEALTLEEPNEPHMRFVVKTVGFDTHMECSIVGAGVGWKTYTEIDNIEWNDDIDNYEGEGNRHPHPITRLVKDFIYDEVRDRIYYETHNPSIPSELTIALGMEGEGKSA